MATVEELIVKITADNDLLKKKLAESQQGVGNFGGAVSKLGPMIAGAFSVAVITNFARASFAAYEEQEKANRRLMFAVKGNQSAYTELTKQAEELRKKTAVDDAAIMQIQQLGAQAGYSTDKIKKITAAAVNLAAVTGQDLQGAYMQLNGTFSGTAGRLTRLDSDFGKLTKTQLESGAAIDLVLKKYGDAASAAALASEKLISNWGEIKESAGGAIGGVINPLLEQMNIWLDAVNSKSSRTAKTWALLNPGQAMAEANAMASINKQRDEYHKKLLEANPLYAKTQANREKQIQAENRLAATLAAINDLKSVDVVETKAQTSALEQWIIAQNNAYAKAQELAQFDVPLPTFGQQGANDVTPINSKGLPAVKLPSAVLPRKAQTDLGDAEKKQPQKLKTR